jgi:hypothetical protein
MIERLQGKVEKVTFIEKYDDGLDYCEIQIDFDAVKIFGDATELLQFVGKDVMYTRRPDVIKGKQEMVVYDLVIISNIMTVESTENIKLIPEGNKRTICNIESKNIRFGEFYPNCIALMSVVQLGSSPKAKWFDCTMIDSESKEFQVRLFASNTTTEEMEELLNSFIGHYVAFDLESTKYGYQTKEIVELPNDVEESPEVIVAKEIIDKLIKSDAALTEYDTKFNFMQNISAVIDGEPGYNFVRMASEIYMINAIDNISTDLDIRAMRRAVICSRGYLLPKKTAWSRPMLNSNKVITVPSLRADKELLLMIDTLSEEEASSTKLTYIKIRGLVNDIINIRRGIIDEKDNSSINAMRSMFNGLL